jgi:hypothetical protein
MEKIRLIVFFIMILACFISFWVTQERDYLILALLFMILDKEMEIK